MLFLLLVAVVMTNHLATHKLKPTKGLMPQTTQR